MNFCLVVVLYLFTFVNQTKAIEINSCSKDDFFLRKTIGRNLILSGESIDVDNVKTYQQCFGHCQKHSCSVFNFKEEIAVNNYRCSIYTVDEPRFKPSTRLRVESSGGVVFERIPCEAGNDFKNSLQGRYQNATTCQDVQNSGAVKSGIYEINDVAGEPGQLQYVYCEMDYLEGGWNVVLRNNGSIDFFQNWQSYKEGFGDYRHSFWAGNEHMHQLTNDKEKEILIILKDQQGEEHFAYYDTFYVTGESNNYRMNVTGHQIKKQPALPQEDGDTQFYEHAGLSFRTWDRASGSICPLVNNYRSGWWFSPCISVFLTGDVSYTCDGDGPHKGIMWEGAGGSKWGTCFKESSMLIRPRKQ